MLRFLRGGGLSMDFSEWRGALIVRDQICDFLAYFLDYPFLLGSYGLEMFAFRAPSAMVINHHLSIEYVSAEHGLAERLKDEILSAGILEFPDRGLL